MPRNLVSAGSYVISRKKAAVLEAMLGTCMGVTLCDRLANVGGLIHLLLPEPTDMVTPWQPEKYAATGLPIFIQALLDAGASRERMQACIAGGALLDPVCELDLIFDIGGRTSAVVEKILHREGISVADAETGGFFACRLSLNLQTWESRIEPSEIVPSFSDKIEFKRPGFDGLDRAIEGVRAIPQVSLEIIRMINNSGYGLREIAQKVRKDQVLSAKVLRLCNSAFLGLRKRLESIDRALEEVSGDQAALTETESKLRRAQQRADRLRLKSKLGCNTVVVEALGPESKNSSVGLRKPRESILFVHGPEAMSALTQCLE